MNKINYLEIFKRAWAIAWHHKYLWWLGLFAGSGMGFNFPSGLQKETENNAWNEKIALFLENHLPLILGIIAFTIALVIILELLKILAFNGLIRSVFGIEKGETKTLGEAIKEGKKFFARVLGIRILFYFLTLALILVLALPVIFLFSTHSYVLGSLTALMAFAILIPALVIFSFISQYGSFYILTSDISVRSALEQGYKIFVKNIGSSLIMSLLFIPIEFLVGSILIIPILVTATLVAFFPFILPINFWIGIPFIILFLILLLFVRSIFSVFYHTAWLLFFKEIATTKKEEVEIKTELVIDGEIQPEKA